MFKGEPIPRTHTQLLDTFDASDSSCKFRTQQARICSLIGQPTNGGKPLVDGTQQDANQINANLALQQMVAQKQQQDSMKSAFRDSAGYESYYNAHIATTNSGAANLLTQAY